MEDKIRSPLVPVQLSIPVEPLVAKSADSPDTPVCLIIADEVLIIKTEITDEAEQVLGKEVSKQQTAVTACAVIKKELAAKAAQIYPQP
jgi:hypothetical protein